MKFRKDYNNRKMEEIKVSVMCLVYNHEKYLRKCLDGFIMQKTNFKFEVLIHDDASTDNSADIIREYEEKYPDIIKPIYQKENQYSQNISINRTYQYPRAKGKYFAFCEGDDYWCDENKLQMQYDVLESHPECVACFHKVATCTESGIILKKTYPINEKSVKEGVISQEEFSTILYLDIGYAFQTSSYFFKKEICEFAIRAEFSKYYNGDENYLRSALINGSIYFINETFSYYRYMSKGSWTARNTNNRANDALQNFKGEIIFDRIANYKYHNKIYSKKGLHINSCCEAISSFNSKKEITDKIKEIQLSFFAFLGHLDMRHKVRVILVCFFPHLWKLIYSSRKRKTRN